MFYQLKFQRMNVLPVMLIRHPAKNLSSIRLSSSTQASNRELREEVVQLYKNLIYLSREWPTDLKPQIRKAFEKNRQVTNEEEIRKLIDRGNYVCREITATYHLRKYRAMKRRYYSDESEKLMSEISKSFENYI